MSIPMARCYDLVSPTIPRIYNGVTHFSVMIDCLVIIDHRLLQGTDTGVVAGSKSVFAVTFVIAGMMVQ